MLLALLCFCVQRSLVVHNFIAFAFAELSYMLKVSGSRIPLLNFWYAIYHGRKFEGNFSQIVIGFCISQQFTGVYRVYLGKSASEDC